MMHRSSLRRGLGLAALSLLATASCSSSTDAEPGSSGGGPSSAGVGGTAAAAGASGQAGAAGKAGKAGAAGKVGGGAGGMGGAAAGGASTGGSATAGSSGKAGGGTSGSAGHSGSGAGGASGGQSGNGGQGGQALPDGPGRFLESTHGALGRFYVRHDLSDLPFDVLVPKASSDWGFGTPDDDEVKAIDPNLSFTSDDYGVRYLAAIVAPSKGTYTISVATSHVATLLVGDAPFVSGQTVTLDPASPTAVRVDFQKSGGGQGFVHLQWTGPGIPAVADIPQENLLPDLRALDQDSAAFAGLAGGAMPVAVFWPNESQLSSSDTTIAPQFRRTDGHTGWKERGVNVVWYNYQLGGGGDVLPMLDVFAKLGLQAWRYPTDALSGNPPVPNAHSVDASDTTLTAYSGYDEAFGKEPAPAFAARNASFRAERPLPVVCNFSGSQLAYFQPPVNVDGIAPFLAACDWLAMDYYPTNEGDGQVVAMPAGIDRMSSALRHLIELSSGKPSFAFVDTSNQKLSASCRAPTGAEVFAMVWGSLIAGARGIAYFPEVPGGGADANDGTTPDVEKALPIVNALLQTWAGVLLDEGISLSPLVLPDGFRGAVRTHGGKRYAIVLNNSDQPSTYHSPGGDRFVYYGVAGPTEGTVFAPYQVVIVHDGTTEVLTPPSP